MFAVKSFDDAILKENRFKSFRESVIITCMGPSLGNILFSILIDPTDYAINLSIPLELAQSLDTQNNLSKQIATNN